MLTKIKNLFNKEETADPSSEKAKSNPLKDEQDGVEEIKDALQNAQKDLTEDVSTDAANENHKEAQNTGSGADTKAAHSTEEIKEEVIKVLKTCYDPEIPVDVWELGLIYDIKVATNGDVLISMTLTSPSCPVAGTLPGEIEQKVKEHPMVNDSKVQLTFDPPWSQKNMSEVAKLELGFL